MTTAAARQIKGDLRAKTRMRVSVRGLVQGVGFRPFVHRQATAQGLAGWVRNSAEGVVLEAEGERSSLDKFLDALERAPPAKATIADINVSEIATRGESGFAILPSDAEGAALTTPAPDYATCPECLAEFFDAANRRYRYPFINCTQCGPRFSVIEDLPYDRARTTMRRFPMCA